MVEDQWLVEKQPPPAYQESQVDIPTHKPRLLGQGLVGLRPVSRRDHRQRLQEIPSERDGVSVRTHQRRVERDSCKNRMGIQYTTILDSTSTIEEEKKIIEEMKQSGELLIKWLPGMWD